MIEDGRFQDGAQHWMQHGRAEEQAGTRPTIDDDAHYRHLPEQARLPSNREIEAFDPTVYLEKNQDVRAQGTEIETAFAHWTRHGRFEARSFANLGGATRRRIRMSALLQRPFGVNLYAPFSARSGLGTAARGYLSALRAAEVPVQLYNLNLSKQPLLITARDFNRAPTYRINVIHANADTIERAATLFPLDQFDDAYTIAIWAWELNALRPDWHGAYAFADEVWTPSDFNTAAVTATAPLPVVTINHALVPRALAPEPGQPGRASQRPFGLPDGFLFLTTFDVGSSIDRKNPYAAVDAFDKAFGGQDGVFLLLKFHSADEDTAGVQRLVRDLRSRRNVIVRSEKMGADDIAKLQACADCFVSPHRSEGFGLNIAEMMQLGKPVIVTGYSGNMDFTTEENSYLIPYAMRPLHRASGPYFPGYLWAEPDTDALAGLMRHVVENRSEAERVGAAGAATVCQMLSPAAIGSRILARFDALGLRAQVPPFVTLLGGSARLAQPPQEALRHAVSIEEVEAHPTISIIVPVYNVDPAWLLRCIESVRAQSYQRWELCLCDDASTAPDTVAALRGYQGIDPRIRIMRMPKNGGIAAASNAAVLMATGGFLLMLDNDDELTPDALQHVAAALTADPTIDVLYSDEDKLDAAGRRADHYYKPDWSPEHLESVMYVLHPLTVRTRLFLELGGFRPEFSGAQDYDLMLRLSRHTDRIHHIPHVLYHWRMIPGSAAAAVDAKPAALGAGAEALAEHVAAKYGADRASVEPGLLPGLFRVRHRIDGNPPVSILILTNNTTAELPGRARFTMVDNLVQSIAERTAYRNYRIVVVDHRNSSPEQFALYKRLGVVLHSYDGPTKPFNYADKSNYSLRLLDTDHVVLMNDDMQVEDGEWLSALMEFSQNPEIGACAGKLLHADRTIQHAGVVLGVHGGATHIYHGFPGDFVGYNAFTHVIRNYSVLTAACLATRRSVIDEVGGFDRRFAIDYNDTDLCLRMRRQGYRLVYTPYSQVIHFESASAKRTVQNPDEVALFRSRWKHAVDRDPYYNPNLSTTRGDFAERDA